MNSKKTKKTNKLLVVSLVILASLILVAIVSTGVSGSKSKSKQETITISMQGPITLSKCQPCHGNIDNFTNPRIYFSSIPAVGKTGHQLHLEKGITCSACHSEFPHSSAGTKRPPMDVCADCHQVAHGTYKMIATGACDACHPPAFNLKTRPASHFPVADWGVNHGKQTPAALEKCYSCHDLAFCTKCHKTPMPHPTFWLKDHKELGKTMEPDCTICHKGKAFCNTCHHIERKLLVVEECKKCHTDFTDSWQTLARNGERALSIHKGHVAKAYPCGTCHVMKKQQLQVNLFNLGDVRVHPTGAKTPTAAALTICADKGCHNAQDPGKPGLIIGNELCNLCHR